VSLALIARADAGGLASQTHEIARHMHPDRILIARPDPRGEVRTDRYASFPEVRLSNHPPDDADMDWLLACDTVMTVEGVYNDAFLARAHQAKRRLVIYANPELFPKHYRELADRGLIDVWAPSPWRLDHLGPNAKHMPMPVATDRFSPAIRNSEASTFLHVSGPAMLDRNGTELVRAALGFYAGPPVTLRIAGPERPPEQTQIGAVLVVPLADVDDYWERWADPSVDCLIQPRRYGGLSLVYQEAAAVGLPTICTDRHPESEWAGTYRVPAADWSLARMKGGRFRVESCDPRDLAHAMETMATTAEGLWSTAALLQTRERSWGHLQAEWNRALQ
jgi:glycosyltransferase involved in cell wall biosynthesis